MRKIVFHIVGYTVVAAGFFWGGALTRDYMVKKESREARARPMRFQNKPVPKMASLTIDLKPWNLRDHAGKVVVLDFWAIWCKPCVAQIPKVKSMHEKFKDRSDFVLFGVSLDEDVADVKKFCDEHQMNWEQLIEPTKGWKNSMALALEVAGVPFVCVIDKKGVIRVYDHFPSDLEKLVERLLAEPNL